MSKDSIGHFWSVSMQLTTHGKCLHSNGGQFRHQWEMFSNPLSQLKISDQCYKCTGKCTRLFQISTLFTSLKKYFFVFRNKAYTKFILQKYDKAILRSPFLYLKINRWHCLCAMGEVEYNIDCLLALMDWPTYHQLKSKLNQIIV